MIEAITRCPQCQTSFRVTEAQLRIAEGSVRCGACLFVFQAEDYLLSPLLDITERLAIEQDYWGDFEDYILQVGAKPESEPEPEPEPEPELDEELETEPATEHEPELTSDSSSEPDDVMSFYLEYIETHPTPVSSPASDPAPSPAPVEEDLSAEVDGESGFADDHKEPSALLGSVERDLPEVDGESPSIDDHKTDFDFDFEHDPEHLFQDRRRFFPFASLKWLPGIALLIGLLGLQWVYLNLASYAQDDRYRDRIMTVCRVAGCSVPDYDNLDVLKTRELVIRSHPETSEALVVDVLLRNSGDFRQQFPGLRLEFMDVRGNIVASRVFKASEYLGGELRGLRYIPALTEVRLSLEIADPGESALGYQMEVVRI